jgi:RimJ/RimL family protein N-acetyltransferase
MMTNRLVLTPVGMDLRLAMDSSRQAFAQLLGVRLPEGWPEFPEAFAPNVDSSPPPWMGYLFADKDSCALIGNGGFVSAPDVAGTVEIGYEIAHEFRNQGFATEAAAALVDIARKAGARAVIAHSLPVLNPSNAVMRKLGMTFIAELGSGDQTVWRWRVELDRPRDRTRVTARGR